MIGYLAPVQKSLKHDHCVTMKQIRRAVPQLSESAQISIQMYSRSELKLVTENVHVEKTYYSSLLVFIVFFVWPASKMSKRSNRQVSFFYTCYSKIKHFFNKLN